MKFPGKEGEKAEEEVKKGGAIVLNKLGSSSTTELHPKLGISAMNAALPLSANKGVLVPYTHHNLTWTQHAFNQKVGEIQGIAKEAFARLK